MRTTALISLRTYLVFSIIFGAMYPLSISLYSMLGMGDMARGSLIEVNGKTVGSKWIGQFNNNPKYFWPRPSATQPPYNAAASSSSNMAVTDPKYKEILQARVVALKAAHPYYDGKIPADLITASASGLDPHISPEAANMQIQRVAKARGVSVGAIDKLVKTHIEHKQFSILGRPRVNVLELNLALDAKEYKD